MPRSTNANQIVSSDNKPLDAVDRQSLKGMGTPAHIRPDNENRSGAKTPVGSTGPDVKPLSPGKTSPKVSRVRSPSSPRATDTGSSSELEGDPLLDTLVNRPNPIVDGMMSDGKNTVLKDSLTEEQKVENYRENITNCLLYTSPSPRDS